MIERILESHEGAEATVEGLLTRPVDVGRAIGS